MTGTIILAAGASSRLGKPKQTLLYKGKSLLQHAVDAAQDAGCSPVVVVLGANKNAVLANFNPGAATIIHNEDWQQGMGSSIRVGMSALLNARNDVSSVIIMVCDQPFVDAALLQSLVAQHVQTGKGIVACTYADTEGVPALFNKKYFDVLLHLQGDAGAKKIMFEHQHDVELVLFEQGVVDIDTMEDLKKLESGNS